MSEPSDDRLNQLREADRERYLSVLFAPEDRRAALATLFLFNAETARLRDLVSEPMPGEIRLQWWREVIGGERAEEARQNPLAAALLDAIVAHDLPASAFDNLLEARIFDLYDDPMPTRTDLEGYLGETASMLIQMACQIVNGGQTPPTADAAGHAGVAYGIATLIRQMPQHRARGQVFLPADLLAAYDRLASRGVGAGLLRRRACEACHMVLSGTDLNVVRAAFDDDTAEMNPDGIHWGFSCHRGIADLVAPVVDAVRRRANRDAAGPTPTPVEARRVNPLT